MPLSQQEQLGDDDKRHESGTKHSIAHVESCVVGSARCCCSPLACVWRALHSALVAIGSAVVAGNARPPLLEGGVEAYRPSGGGCVAFAATLMRRRESRSRRLAMRAPVRNGRLLVNAHGPRAARARSAAAAAPSRRAAAI